VLAARDEAAHVGALVVTAHLDNYLAWMARDRWDSGDAEAAAERCVEAARRFGLTALAAVAVTARAIAAAQRSDREEMDGRIAEALEVDPENVDVRALCGAARVTYAVRRDDMTRARSELETTMTYLRSARTPAPERGLWVLLRAVDDRDPETALAELAAGPGSTHAMNSTYARYARAVIAGRAGDAEGAAQHLPRADAAGAMAWQHHHARRVIAESALADGWGHPVEWLRDALAYFDARGDDAIAAGCRGLLARAGAPVPRAARSDGAVPSDLMARGVTARELEVLELLGEARSTREIAALLYLSPKTVERHISNLATKLTVEGRAALVAFAAARVARSSS
jgi:DNA-binding CsgD family transcriptional regulator